MSLRRMEITTQRLPRRICATLIAMSLVVGWLIPAFYEWTDSDQSRPSPLLWQVPLIAPIAAVMFVATLPWLTVLSVEKTSQAGMPLQFRMRTLLGATIVVAVCLAGMMTFPLGVSYLVSAVTLVCFVAFF